MTTCYIGLGANLGQAEQTLRQALQALMACQHSRIEACSSFYGSRAVGPGTQPDYVNAVAHLESELPAQQVLQWLHEIEHKFHWQRAHRLQLCLQTD